MTALPYNPRELARFLKAHPTLEGYSATCAFCAFRDDGDRLGNDVLCRLVPPSEQGAPRPYNADCNQATEDGAAAFVFDSRPHREQCGALTDAQYAVMYGKERKAGELEKWLHKKAVAAFVADGHDVSQIPTITMGGKARPWLPGFSGWHPGMKMVDQGGGYDPALVPLEGQAAPVAPASPNTPNDKEAA